MNGPEGIDPNAVEDFNADEAQVQWQVEMGGIEPSASAVEDVLSDFHSGDMRHSTPHADRQVERMSGKLIERAQAEAGTDDQFRDFRDDEGTNIHVSAGNRPKNAYAVEYTPDGQTTTNVQVDGWSGEAKLSLTERDKDGNKTEYKTGTDHNYRRNPSSIDGESSGLTEQDRRDMAAHILNKQRGAINKARKVRQNSESNDSGRTAA